MLTLPRARRLAFVISVTLVACEDATSVRSGPLDSIVLSRRSVPLTVGDTFNVGIQVTGGTDAAAHPQLEWLSLEPSVAEVRPGDVLPSSIDQDLPLQFGLGPTPGASLVGRAPGSTQVIVRGGGRADTVAVTVFGTAHSGSPFLARSLASGGNGRHGCAIGLDDLAYCWGDNSSGQLGDGTVAPRGGATRVANTERFASLALGGSHSCGLTEQGAVYCWGVADAVGHADTARGWAVLPARVALPTPITQLDAYASTTCGLTAQGAVYCWGTTPIVGTSPPRSRTVAPTLVPSALGFSALAVGGLGNCALTREGAAYCWGALLPGLAPEQTADGVVEPLAFAPDTRFASLAMFGFDAGLAPFACGTTAVGDTRCWMQLLRDRTDSGQRILIDSGHAVTALSVGVHRVRYGTSSVVAARQLCGVTPRRELRCWNGETGDLTTTFGPMTTVAGVSDVADLAAGSHHVCALTGGGEVLCWGGNRYGQLGDGTLQMRAAPARVRGAAVAARRTAAAGG